jgi:hypothetical protein
MISKKSEFEDSEFEMELHEKVIKNKKKDFDDSAHDSDD